MTKRLLSVLATGTAALLLTGCALLPLGALLPMTGTAYSGYVMWKSGEATKYYAFDIDATYQAVRQAAQQLKIESRLTKSAPQKEYALETEGRVPMQIEISPYEKGVTKVFISISPFGDKHYVEFFYQLVDENLRQKTAGAGNTRLSAPETSTPAPPH